jgi:hypothetical protein
VVREEAWVCVCEAPANEQRSVARFVSQGLLRAAKPHQEAILLATARRARAS